MINIRAAIQHRVELLKNRIHQAIAQRLPAKSYGQKYEFDQTICAVLKNEGDILEEWVLFHLAVGIEHFVLWDDQSTDNSREILKPYEEAGLVEWHPLPYSRHTVNNQVKTYSRTIEMLRYKSKWVWFLDLDEFIIPAKSDSLKPVMDNISTNPNVGSVQVNWLFFGTAGVQKLKAEEWYIDKLNRRAPLDWKNHRATKCALRPEAASRFIWHPHYPLLYKGKEQVYANLELFDDRTVNYDHLILHHYWHRTEDYFRKEKIRRKEYMTGTKRGPKALALHHETHNMVEDNSMQRFLPKMREIKEALRSGKEHFISKITS